MKKMTKLTALSFIATFASGVAFAEESIGLINVQYLYSHHPDRQTLFEKLQEEAKKPMAKLQAEEKQIVAEKEKLSKEVENKVKALEKSAPKLSQAQIKQRQEEIEKFIQKSESDLKKMIEKFQSETESFNAENQQAMNATNERLLKGIQTATDNVAKTKKFTLVLDEKAAIFAQEGKDITQDVLKELERITKAK